MSAKSNKKDELLDSTMGAISSVGKKIEQQKRNPQVLNYNIKKIHLDNIKTKPQVRKNFDESSIKELAESISEIGLIQPIEVIATDDRYLIISGERRFRAFQYLKIDKIPSIIKETVCEKDITTRQLIENIQREDLSPIEEAMAYKKIIDENGYSYAELAQKLGKSKATIVEMMGINKTIKAVEKIEDNSGRSTDRLKYLPKFALTKLATIVDKPYFEKIFNMDFSEIGQKDLRGLIKKEEENLQKGEVETEKKKKDIKTKLEDIRNSLKKFTKVSVGTILDLEKYTIDGKPDNEVLEWIESLQEELKRSLRVVNAMLDDKKGLEDVVSIPKDIIKEKESIISYPQFGNFPYTHFSLTSTKTNNSTVQLLLESEYSFISYRENEEKVRKLIIDCVPELVADKIFDNPGIDLDTIIDQWNALPFQKVENLAGYFYSAVTKKFGTPKLYKEQKKKAMANLKVIENFEKDENYTAAAMKESNPARYEDSIQALFRERPYDLKKSEDKKLFYLALEAKFNTH